MQPITTAAMMSLVSTAPFTPAKAPTAQQRDATEIEKKIIEKTGLVMPPLSLSLGCADLHG
tara:strand:- start:480 stop:662 length:183 start_codon:yes stop_codon:yes gene_type:complete